MITVRVYSNVGELIGPVALDLRKSDAAFRLQKALLEKGSGVMPADLERLDVGTLPLATLSKVYTPGDIRKAIVRNVESLRKSAATTDEILAKVESENLWSGQRRKSRAKVNDEAADVLGKYSYKDASGKGEHFAHRDGHTCSVKRDGSWSHRSAPGHVMSDRDAAGLRRLLSSIHGV
jgi:hypothetical protein